MPDSEFHIPGWLWVGILGFILIATPFLIWLPRYTTSNPEYCLSCHGQGDIPNRGIESKVHPSFSEVTCTQCHAKPGQIVYEGYRKGFMSEPERVTPNCINCHDDIKYKNDIQEFKFNVMNIKIPHKLHIEMGAKCLDCHSNIAHDLKQPQTNRPRMEYCSQCHAAVTESCIKCHGEKIPPGPIPYAPPAGITGDGRSLYSRYCIECHGIKGDGVEGINLRSREFLEGRGFVALWEMATEGHGGMPAFGKEKGG
ncbi:MAG: c-type cytochrome, partial [Fidelibacterota bacterium]